MVLALLSAVQSAHGILWQLHCLLHSLLPECIWHDALSPAKPEVAQKEWVLDTKHTGLHRRAINLTVWLRQNCRAGARLLRFWRFSSRAGSFRQLITVIPLIH
jgi:hypothetical protein